MHIQPTAQKGQGLVEYGLILTLVSLLVVTTVSMFGSQVVDLFTNITGSL